MLRYFCRFSVPWEKKLLCLCPLALMHSRGVAGTEQAAQGGAVQRACGRPSPVHVSPGFLGTGSRSLTCVHPFCSSLAPLSQAKHRGKHRVEAAQHFPHASLPQGVMAHLYMLEFILYLPSPTHSSTVRPPAG